MMLGCMFFWIDFCFCSSAWPLSWLESLVLRLKTERISLHYVPYATGCRSSRLVRCLRFLGSKFKTPNAGSHALSLGNAFIPELYKPISEIPNYTEQET